jgi:hypothetical protein
MIDVKKAYFTKDLCKSFFKSGDMCWQVEVGRYISGDMFYSSEALTMPESLGRKVDIFEQSAFFITQQKQMTM